MPAVISWLDASTEEQRRVREIVTLFSQRETQDEMGGRKIVVALSDALFPGTSVLHSRARYLLFVPWLCKSAATSSNPAGRLERLERQLIQAFLEDDTVPAEDRLNGLVGAAAGPKVRQLPSTAYWSALRAWGILEWEGRIDETLARTKELAKARAHEDADELAERSVRVWNPGVGNAPPGFPDQDICGGFRLRPEEALWLKERWLERAPGSMLAHLACSEEPLSGSFPWSEPVCRSASPDLVALLDQAERFSLMIDGARSLYSLLLAEAYQSHGFDGVPVDLDLYRGHVLGWQDEAADRSALFEGWRPSELWDLLRARQVVVDPHSQQFFDLWFTVTVNPAGEDLVGDKDLRSSVERRERFLKGKQSRLQNPKLLASWKGGLPARTSYRWPQVRRMVSDVIDVLNDDDAGA